MKWMKRIIKVLSLILILDIFRLNIRGAGNMAELFRQRMWVSLGLRASGLLLPAGLAVCILWGLLTEWKKAGDTAEITGTENNGKDRSFRLALASLITIGLYISYGFLIMGKGLGIQSGLGEMLENCFASPIGLLNLYYVLLLGVCLYGLAGEGIGLILNGLVILFLFVGNYIKLLYHDTFFTWFDLLQVKEALLMGAEFMTASIAALLIAAAAAGIILLIRFRKRIAAFLKPRFQVLPFLTAGILLVILVVGLFRDDFKELDVYQRTWENEKVNVQCNGEIVSLLYNLRTVREAVMEKPEQYNEKYAKELKEQFAALQKEPEETNPDVIVILAESLFDLDGVEGMEFSEDIDETIDRYSDTTLISPRYGGYTSAVEFEVLTGLSLAFMPSALTPYTTYFNNTNDEFPCIVREFKDAGYQTTAVHPGMQGFYNRDVVYQSLGFDEFLSITDFEPNVENTTLNGWMKDEALADKLVELLKNSQEPQFLFGITMESHYVTMEKYEETEVKLEAGKLDEAEIHEVEQQAQSYYNTDKMIEKLIQYIEQTDTPTLLYVFGDHLPPISELGKLGYLYDIYHKYGTTLVMYSNYKELSTGCDYMTPNQLAAQVITDAEISHSSYYDYIYSLREKYPVIQQEFTEVKENTDLDLYRYIQYDILFGQRWLAE